MLSSNSTDLQSLEGTQLTFTQANHEIRVDICIDDRFFHRTLHRYLISLHRRQLKQQQQKRMNSLYSQKPLMIPRRYIHRVSYLPRLSYLSNIFLMPQVHSYQIAAGVPMTKQTAKTKVDKALAAGH